MNRRLVALVAAAAVFLPFAQVYALESADDWDQQVDSNGIITLTDGTILIQGSNNAGPGYPWQNTVTGLTTDSSIGETVSFGWAYWTTDGAYYDRAQMLLNESWVDLAIWNQGGYNAQQQSGSQEVYITSGGIFGFRILSTDSCCGAGFLQINNTTWVVGSPAPSPTPTPEPTPTPTPEPSVEPSPSPTEAPTPSPEPSVEPTPEPTPQPTPEPSPEPSPEPTPVLTPEPTPEPSEEPTNEPTPDPTAEPSAEPSPSPEPTEEPEDSPDPSPDPTDVPSPQPESVLPDLGEAAEAVAEAVGEAAEAVAEAVTEAAEAVFEVAGESVQAVADGLGDIAAIGEIGKDLDATEKEEAQPMAVAVISSQIASVAAAAANAARSTTGGSSGGGGGGGDMKSGRKSTSNRKDTRRV